MNTQAEISGSLDVELRWLRNPFLSTSFGKALCAAYRWACSQAIGLVSRQGTRRLNVVETVSLGEKRFVSILCVDEEQFLLAGSSSEIVVLAKLDKRETRGEKADTCVPFSELLSCASIDSIKNAASKAASSDGADL